jgi:CRP/FNR family transcriptional regulator, anaerobic regulatory protein
MDKARSRDADQLSLGGPSVTGRLLWASSGANTVQLLTDEDRALLAPIGSAIQLKEGAKIFRQGDDAAAVFNVIHGVVKVYRTLPDGTERIMSFMFPGDLLGLPEEGKYVLSARAVTAVTVYRFLVPALESLLRANAALEFRLLSKVCHELHEVGRHSVIVARRPGLAKIALFLQMLESHQPAGGGTDEVYIPMSRSDIADYVAMSSEAVSRTFRALADLGVIGFRDKRHATIIDRARLETIAAQDRKCAKARSDQEMGDRSGLAST